MVTHRFSKFLPGRLPIIWRFSRNAGIRTGKDRQQDEKIKESHEKSSLLDSKLNIINTIFGIIKYNRHNIWYVKLKKQDSLKRLLSRINLRRAWKFEGIMKAV